MRSKQLLYMLSGMLGMLWGCGEQNRPPSLEFIKDQNVIVGNELLISIFASDPDGDALLFEQVEAPSGARLEQQGTQALFRWAPLITQAETTGKSFPVVIRVTDSKGAFAEQEFFVSALFEGGVPTFITPNGFVANLAEENHVAFLVEVKDDDDVTVNLTMADGIPGAIFQQVSGKVASFFWKPTQTQVDTSSFWSIMVTANDGVHPVVQYPVSIVLVNADSDSCPGNPPSIQHIALPDQHVAPPYLVTASATDSESGISSMILEWRNGESGTLKSVEMQEASTGLYVGEIDSPPIPGSQATVLLYRLIARDNDDITGSGCDHTVTIPKAGEQAFVAYGPDADGDCKEDVFEPNESAYTAAPISTGIHAALRNCGGEDWFRVTLPADRSLVATMQAEPDHGALVLSVCDVNGNPLKVAPYGGTQELVYGPVASDTELSILVAPEGEVSMTYALQLEYIEGGCPPDALEPNDGVIDAKKLGPGTYSNLEICPGDQDWFALELSAGDHLSLALNFEQSEGDLDLRLLAADGVTTLASSITVTSDEFIEFDAYEPEWVYAVVSGFSGNANQYSLSIALSDQASGCKDDILEGNQSTLLAHPILEGTLAGLMACPGSADYFVYHLNGGETIVVDTFPEANTLPPLVRLEDKQGNTLVGPKGNDGTSAFAQTTVQGPGPVFVVVNPLQSIAAPYALELQVSDPPGACKGDRLEPNNNLSSAKAVEGVVTSHLTLCAGDEDWLFWELPQFSTVEIRVQFDDHLGALDLSLHWINGELVKTVKGSGEVVLTTFLEEGGAYYIRVHGGANEGLGYDLVTTVY